MQPKASLIPAPVGSYIPRNCVDVYHWFRKLAGDDEHRDEDGFCIHPTDSRVPPTLGRAFEAQGLVEYRLPPKGEFMRNRRHRITETGRAALADYIAIRGMSSRDADAFLKSQAMGRMMGEAA